MKIKNVTVDRDGLASDLWEGNGTLLLVNVIYGNRVTSGLMQLRQTIPNFNFVVLGPSQTNAISARIHAVPMNISLNPGANLTLTCLVQHGGPADAIQWFKYDQPISIKQRSNPLQQKISLKNITRADAGKYKCTVWKGKQTDTDVFYLQVNGNCMQLNFDLFCAKKLIIRRKKKTLFSTTQPSKLE